MTAAAPYFTFNATFTPACMALPAPTRGSGQKPDKEMQLVYYVGIAKDTSILVDFGKQRKVLAHVLSGVLAHVPPLVKRYSLGYGRTVALFLFSEGFTYFSVADEALGRERGFQVLSQVRAAFLERLGTTTNSSYSGSFALSLSAGPSVRDNSLGSFVDSGSSDLPGSEPPAPELPGRKHQRSRSASQLNTMMFEAMESIFEGIVASCRGLPLPKPCLDTYPDAPDAYLTSKKSLHEPDLLESPSKETKREGGGMGGTRAGTGAARESLMGEIAAMLREIEDGGEDDKGGEGWGEAEGDKGAAGRKGGRSRFLEEVESEEMEDETLRALGMVAGGDKWYSVAGMQFPRVKPRREAAQKDDWNTVEIGHSFAGARRSQEGLDAGPAEFRAILGREPKGPKGPKVPLELLSVVPDFRELQAQRVTAVPRDAAGGAPKEGSAGASAERSERRGLKERGAMEKGRLPLAVSSGVLQPALIFPGMGEEGEEGDEDGGQATLQKSLSMSLREQDSEDLARDLVEGGQGSASDRRIRSRPEPLASRLRAMGRNQGGTEEPSTPRGVDVFSGIPETPGGGSKAGRMKLYGPHLSFKSALNMFRSGSLAGRGSSKSKSSRSLGEMLPVTEGATDGVSNSDSVRVAEVDAASLAAKKGRHKLEEGQGVAEGSGVEGGPGHTSALSTSSVSGLSTVSGSTARSISTTSSSTTSTNTITATKAAEITKRIGALGSLMRRGGEADPQGASGGWRLPGRKGQVKSLRGEGLPAASTPNLKADDSF